MKKSFARVNFIEGQIEMTATYAKAAGVVGSEEYKDFLAIKREFPDFKVVIVASKKKSGSNMKGLTMEYMEKYIKEHDDEERSTLTTFAKLRGMTVKVAENGTDCKLVEDPNMAIVGVAAYGEIKMWFLETYHDVFEAYEREAKEIIKKTKNARAARRAA